MNDTGVVKQEQEPAKPEAKDTSAVEKSVPDEADAPNGETDDATPETQEPAAQEPETQEPEQGPEEEPLFTDTNETVYATTTVNTRSGPGTSYDKVGSLALGNAVTRTGIGQGTAEGWSRVALSDGTVVYVSSQYLSTTKPTPPPAPKPSSNKSSGGSSSSKGSSGSSSSGSSSGSSGSSGGSSGSTTESSSDSTNSDDVLEWKRQRAEAGGMTLEEYMEFENRHLELIERRAKELGIGVSS